MKRTYDVDSLDAKRRARVIRLNIGGVHFDTTPETLSAIPFFDPVVDQRIGYAVDRDDRFFVDRSGELFGIILQFLRTRKRPSQNALKTCGQLRIHNLNSLNPYDTLKSLESDGYKTHFPKSNFSIQGDKFLQRTTKNKQKAWRQTTQTSW